MKNLDEIIYLAIKADDALMEAIGGRVESTCFEVSPDEPDNTPVPYLIVTDDGLKSSQPTKDDVWEGDGSDDQVQASVIIAGREPREVQRLTRMVRRAVRSYVCDMCDQGEEIPTLNALTASQLSWDWEKPCYYREVNYQCTVPTNFEDEEDEQEE